LRRLSALVSVGVICQAGYFNHAGECRDALHNPLRISHDGG
jgi:hypothetical protein